MSVIYVIAALVYVTDQYIKWIVKTQMGLNEAIPVLPHVLYIDYIRNPGAAWGILDHARWLLVLVALAVVAAAIYFHRRYKPGWWLTVALGLLLGGALGNMTDRILTGTVVDYIYFKIINFPVFNFADMSIDTGVIMILLKSLLMDRNRSDQDQKSKLKDVKE
jgi:signal peptidase II